MTEEQKLSKLEHLKKESHQLRGTLQEELANDKDHFSSDATQILKHHGSYQQDQRDLRKVKNADGTPKGKAWQCMVRTRIPGGKVTAEQFLTELELCDQYGNGTVRITTRQGFQLHGVLKKNIKRAIRDINNSKLTTFCACGDVSRNVMCCPAPYRNNSVRTTLQETASRVAELLKPKTTAYYDLWLTDEEGVKTNHAEFQPVEEPIYGERYLPRKFKVGFAVPEDNCIDLYTQDLGYLAIVENNEIVAWNVLVGGGMGMTPALKHTFPALAHRMACIPSTDILAVTEAVVKVQRDFGNREDRKVARMKYLIANWGLEKFKAKVEEYLGAKLEEPHPADVTNVDDHLGWHEQGDGKWFLGINVENGRIKDEGELRLKSGLRAILEQYMMPTRLTALQSVILCDIEEAAREEINHTLQEHGIKQAEELTLSRRYSMACPALPTCGLSVTESERVMPDVMDDIETELAKHHLTSERVSVHMTGCPNGCARPYTPDVGLVGKSRGKYTLYLGGNAEGTRLAFLYEDQVPQQEIASRLSPLLQYFKQDRSDSESFGDFCNRVGKDQLVKYAESFDSQA